MVVWRPNFEYDFYRLNFYKPHFIVYTIHLINSSTSRWFHEVMWWSINILSQNSLELPIKFHTLVDEYFD
jgi:hypothetical protein